MNNLNTKEAYEKGFIPTLYTNADYAASNKCYQKVGFVDKETVPYERDNIIEMAITKEEFG